MPVEALACGAGVGDLRQSAASKSACEACSGTLAYDVSWDVWADGLGYTSCSGGRAPAQNAAPRHHDVMPVEVPETAAPGVTAATGTQARPDE
eukprot:13104134-Heterocapsa_arctica.AAC.1